MPEGDLSMQADALTYVGTNLIPGVMILYLTQQIFAAPRHAMLRFQT